MVEPGRRSPAPRRSSSPSSTTQFGGSAKAFGETFPGQLAKLRNAFDELAAKVAGALLPALTSFVGFMVDHMPQIEAAVGTAMTFIGEQIERLEPAFASAKTFVLDFAATLAPSLENVLGKIRSLGQAVQSILPQLQSIGGTALSVGMSSFGQSALAAGVAMYAFHAAVSAVITRLVALKAAAASAGLASMMTPLGLLTAGVGLLAFAFYKTQIASDGTTSSLQRQRDALMALRSASDESTHAQQRLRDAKIALKQAILDVSTALQRRNQLEAEGKKGSDAYRQSQVDVERAYSNRKRSELEVNDAANAVTDSAKKGSSAIKDLAQSARETTTESGRLAGALGKVGESADKHRVVNKYATELRQLAKEAEAVAVGAGKANPKIAESAKNFAAQARAAADVAKTTGEIPAAFNLVVGPSGVAGQKIGAALGDGILAGIGSKVAAIAAAAASAVRAAEAAARSEAKAKSPSQLFADLGSDLSEGMVKGIESKYATLGEAGKNTVDKAIDAARAALDAKRDVLANAFDALAERGLQAFDARTQKMAEKIEARFDALIAKIQAKGAALTPAEKALEQARDDMAREGRESNLAGARSDLAAASAAGDEEAARAARERIVAAEREIGLAWLEEQAQTERIARDKRTAVKLAAAEREREQERLNMQSSRNEQRLALEGQLALLREFLDKHPQAWRGLLKKLNKMFGDEWAPAFYKTGNNLGQAFAEGILNSIEKIEQAGRILAQTIAKYLPKSPAEKGPLSNLDKVGPALVDTIAKGIDPKPIERALEAMRLPGLSLGVAPRVVAPGIPGGAAAAFGGPVRPIVIELHETIELDGFTLWQNMKRESIRDARANAGTSGAR